MSWAVHADNGGKPATQPLAPARSVASTEVPRDDYVLAQLTHPQGVPLEPDTEYWIVITEHNPTRNPLLYSPITEFTGGLQPDRIAYPIDAGSDAGWSLGYQALAFEGGNWQPFMKSAELPGESVFRMALVAPPRTPGDTPGVVTITDADTDGDIEVGDALTATLTDPDTVTTGTVTWQWSRATRPDGNYTTIPTALTNTYTPTNDDTNYYLRATADYTDNHAPNKHAHTTTPTPVGIQAATLVKNTGGASSALELSGAVAGGSLYQPFTTGGNPGGYALSSVGLEFAGAGRSVDAVEIWTKASGQNRPGELLHTLQAPTALGANAVSRFAAPAAAVLKPSTTYFIRADNPVAANATAQASADPGAALGWAMSDRAVEYTSTNAYSSTAATSLKIDVRGLALSGPPGPPLDASAVGGDEAVRVSWQPPALTGHSEVTKYQVRHKETSENDSEYSLWTDVDADQRSAVVSDLTTDTNYTFQVRAWNEHGPGPTAETTGTPTSSNTLVSNVGQADGSVLSSASGRGRFAQMFTTGSDPGGYVLGSVEVGLSAASGVGVEVRLLAEAVERGDGVVDVDGNEWFVVPGVVLATLSAAGTADEDVSTFEVFTAHDVLLEPDRRYWVEVAKTSGADAGLSVATTSSERGVDAAFVPGFTVGDNVWAYESSSWGNHRDTLDANLKIRVSGSVGDMEPGPYVSNRYQQTRATAAQTSSSTTRYATSFETGVHEAGYSLGSVVLSVAAASGTVPRVRIHADNSGEPAASPITNGTLSVPSGIATDLSAPDRAVFTANTAPTLAKSTTYWVVVDRGSGSGNISVATTASNGEDFFSFNFWQRTGNWFIGNAMSAYDGSSWTADGDGRSLAVSVSGTTDEFSPGPDASTGVVMGAAQVGVAVRASVVHEHRRVHDVTWQWQRAPARGGPFTDIPSAEGGTQEYYTPAAADRGMWLKVKVSYSNAFGSGKTDEDVTLRPVLGAATVSNAGYFFNNGVETFPDGAPSTAQAFSTGPNPGGYLLREVRLAISAHPAPDRPLDASWAVHADGGGEPAAQPLAPAKAITGSEINHDAHVLMQLTHPQGVPLEPDTKYWVVISDDTPVHTPLGYSATNEWDGGLAPDRLAYPIDAGSEAGWSLDYEALAIEDGRWQRYMLGVELPGDAVMRMALVAVPRTPGDTAGTVTITDADTDGNIETGDTLTATVTDPDTVTANTVTWQWSRATRPDGNYTAIPTALTATYTPTADDHGHWLRATADYTDNHAPNKHAHGTTPTPVGVPAATLVKNTGQGSVGGGRSFSNLHAAFTTGDNPAGYGLSGVGIGWLGGSLSSGAVEVREHASSTAAGEVVAVLEGPDVLAANEVNWFSAPAGTKLEANTSYFVRIANAANIDMTDSDREDPGAAHGWVVGDVSRYGASVSALSSVTSSVPRIDIRGVANSGPPGPPRVLTATAGDEAVWVSWQPPGSSGHADVTRYQVRYKQSSQADSAFSAWADVDSNPDPEDKPEDSDLPSERSVLIDDLTTGTAYTFEVRVWNEYGSGDAGSVTATPVALATLVSNKDQTAGSEVTMVIAQGPDALATTFTTGSAAYAVWSVEMGLNLGSVRVFDLQLLEAVTGSDPDTGSVLGIGQGYTLASSDTDTATFDSFVVPGRVLKANTTYWAMIRTDVLDNVVVATASTDGEDTVSPSTGWTIGNFHRARDSGTWGSDQSDELKLVIKGREAHTRPAFDAAEAERSIDEDVAVGAELGDPIAADDVDGDSVTHSVAAASVPGGAGHFAAFNRDFDLDPSTGQVTVRAGNEIDHEARSSYVVEIHASDGEDTAGATESVPAVDAVMVLTVQVGDVDEPGVVSVTGQAAPGGTLEASLDDPDGASSVIWQWKSSATKTGTYENVSGADTAAYSPVQADEGKWLRATVVYTDPFGSDKTAESVPLGPVVSDSVPQFASGAVSRSVAEDAAGGTAVGAPVAAADLDGDTLAYSLAATGEADGAAQLAAFRRDFDLDAATAQVTVKPGASLDYEAGQRAYKVLVQVTDGEDISGDPETGTPSVDDSTVLTVEVTNVDEPAEVTLSGTAAVGVRLRAQVTDPDGSVSVQSWQWSRSSSSGGPFTNINGETGRDYVVVLADEGHWLRATATYTDAFGSNKTGHATTDTAVREANRTNEEPVFDAAAYSATVPESAPAGTEVGVFGATDGDGDTVHCTVADDDLVPGDDLAAFRRDFQWDCASGRLTVRPGALLDYETRTSYAVLLEVSDRQNLIDQPDTFIDDEARLRVDVANADDPGTVAIEGDAAVGLAISAALTDPDGAPTEVSWQWSVSDSQTGPFTDIEDADEALYVPAEPDVGRWLRATAAYTDPQGPNKTASAVPATAVAAVPPPPRDRAQWRRVSFTRDRDTAYYSLAGWNPETVRVEEGGGAATVWVRLDRSQVVRPYSVPVTVVHGGGASESDYRISPAVVSFQPEEAFASFTVEALADGVDDDNEYLILGLDVPDGLRAGHVTSLRVDLVDDPQDIPPARLSFDAASASADEGEWVTATVTLGAPPDESIQNWSVLARLEVSSTLENGDGVHLARTDRTQLRFSSGKMSDTVRVLCGSDRVDGPGHTVTVRLGRVTAGSRSSGPTHTLELETGTGIHHELVVDCANADEPADLWAHMTVSGRGPWYRPTESSAPARVIVALSNPADREVTIPIETAHHGNLTAADYTGVPDTVTFAVGQQTAAFEVWAIDDDIDDDGEWLEIRLGTLPAGVALASGQTYHSAPDAYWDRSRYAIEIIDDDDTPITATTGTTSASTSFIDTAHTVEPGGVVTVTVELYRFKPFGQTRVQQQVTLPLAYSYSSSATATDWGSGARGADPLPTTLVFEPGQRHHKFRIIATGPHTPHNPKTITITFGTLPQGVTAYTDQNHQNTITITITDD